MEIIKLIAVILGATGFWKLVEIIIRFRSDKKLKNAEVRNLDAQTEKQVTENWIQWSQTLEKRVKESEEHTENMQKIIETQRKKIRELERKVAEMEKKNLDLTRQLNELKSKGNESKGR